MLNDIVKIIICILTFAYGLYDFIQNEKWIKEH